MANWTTAHRRSAAGLSRPRAIIVAIALAALGCGKSRPLPKNPANTDASTETKPARPAHWATPIANQPGLPNFYQIDDHLFRGAQPDDEGFAQLKALGIKTVVNLRSVRSDRSECRKHGLDYVKIPMKAWHAKDKSLIRFLEVATDPSRQPVFVHCKHGADRTGTAVAIYRMVVQGWSKDEAIAEMTRGGFGFHSIWQNLIDYLRKLDVEKLARAVR